MTLRYMTGESREDEERRNCQRCDHYRGYVCAEHREPSYESMKEALSGVAPCGHENRFVEWEDHSKPISCVVCEIESVRQRLAAAEAAIKAQEEEAARTHDAWGEEVNDYATRLAAAEATIERLSRGILNAAGWRECEGDPLGKSNEDLAS